MADILSFGKRVWKGDVSTVSEAQEAYVQNPDAAFIRLLMTLYSFRTNSQFAEELLSHRSGLIDRAKREINRNFAGASVLDRANLADVLSTYLEWMSRQKQVSVEEQRELHLAASQVCKSSIVITDEIDPAHHSWSLIKLTAARLALNERDFPLATSYLNRVSWRASEIADHNQRVRVQAKLGLLLRKCRWYLRGFYWGVRACFVPNVPLNVRLKAFAALLHIDR